MAFTSNINTAVERSQARTQSEQAQREAQERSISANAIENQRSREHDEKMYNIKAGDVWMLNNPISELGDDDINNLGEDVFNVHANSVNEIKEGRKLLYSGNVQDRIKGQQMITKANNAVKELKLDYEILEEDTQMYLSEDNLDSDSHQKVSAVAEAFTDGRVRIVSSRNAGKVDDNGRWIEYTDEETGEKNYVNFKDYKRMLKNGLKRVDVNAWLKTTGDNLEVDEIINADGTSDKRLKSPEAIDAHIDNLLSDDKSINALLQQFDIKTDDPSMSVQERQDNDLSVLRERLTTSLKAQKGIKVDKEKTPPRAVSASASKPEKGARGMSHRHWQVIQSTQGDPKGAEQFLLGELKGTSPIKGAGVGDQVKGVSIDPTSNIITISFVGESEPLNVPWKQGPVNDLFNSFATNVDEQKYNIADVFAQPAQQATGAAPDVSGSVRSKDNKALITKLVNDFTNEQTGQVDMSGFVKSIREGSQFGKVLGKAEIKNKNVIFGSDGVQFFGTKYNLNDAQERAKFINAFAKKVGDSSGNQKVDAFGNPIK